MDQRIPEIIQPLLNAYLTLMDEQLPGFMSACYLHGSIALDAFNPHTSDIDFIAVITRPCSESDLENLETIHEQIANDYQQWLLEGSYIQPADLGQPEDVIPPCPYYHENELDPAGHFDLNSVTWWVLKDRGVTLKGVEAADLPYTINWDTVIENMHQNLNTYWLGWTKKTGIIAPFLFDFVIHWTVSGTLRQFYSFKEHDITSKTGACKYGLTTLPSRWHRVIQEALNLMEQEKPVSLYRLKILRAVDAFRFIRYIVSHPVMQGTKPDPETE